MAIIVFANQKGGVGKTTLAMMYANYLGMRGERDVLVIDTDFQQSLVNQRTQDIDVWGEDEMNYNVEYFRLENMKQSQAVMMKAKGLDPAVVIVDIPGNITDDYIAPLLIYADVIVCPYQYENKTLDSTSTFLKVIQKLKERYSDVMKAKLIYVPNQVDSRIGTKDEMALWKKIDELFSRYGDVSPRVPYRAELKRVNTYINTPKQLEQTKECFGFLDKQYS